MSGETPKKAEIDGRVLDELYAVIESRREADPAASYTAQLLHGGLEAIARKLGEEALESVIAGVAGRPEHVAAESADLLYHLLVLWAAKGVRPAEVWSVLEARRGVSGLVEKAARGKD